MPTDDDDSDRRMIKAEKKRLREEDRRRKFLQAYAAHNGVQLAPIAVSGFRAKRSSKVARHYHSWTPRKTAVMQKVAAALLREEEAEYEEEEEEEEEVYEYEHEYEAQYETEHHDDREVENHVQAERIVPEQEEWMRQYAPQQQQQQKSQQQPSLTDHPMENWMAHYPTASQQHQHSQPTNSGCRPQPQSCVIPQQPPEPLAYVNMRRESAPYPISALHVEPQPHSMDSSVQRHRYDAVTSHAPVFVPEPSMTTTNTYSHQIWYVLILVGLALLFLSERYQFCPYLASVTASILVTFAAGRLTAATTDHDPC